MSPFQVGPSSGSTPEPRVTRGTLTTVAGLPLPLARTEVVARVAGPLAEVEVKQLFENRTDQSIEAIYLFPLPHRAAVHTLRFRIGGRTVEGSVKEKEEARRDYQAARKAGQRATLVEQERPNLFTMSVANVGAGERVEVTLGYQERLAFDDGEYRLVFPMVAGDRFHGGVPTGEVPRGGHAPPTSEVGDGDRVRPRRLAGGEEAAPVSLEVSLRAGCDIEAPRCASHKVSVARFGAGSYTVRLDGEAPPDRDFVLRWRTSAATDRTARPLVWLSRRHDRHGERPGTFLVALTPPEVVEPAETRPRDVVVVLDRSASMRGGSLDQARRAVRFVAAGLGREDRLALVLFDHEVIEAVGGGGQGLVAQPTAMPRLEAALDGLVPRGGSELLPALRAACALLPADEAARRTRMVVLVTDAAMGNDGVLLREVPRLLDGRRLFVLGVGPAVNRHLCERLAEVGGGASDVVLPGEDLEPALSRFRRRVEQGGPVLTDLRLTWQGALPSDVYPQPLPDLFGGQPVLAVGRYAGEGRTTLTLTGRTATGRPFSVEQEVVLPAESDDCPGLERLWARHRIDARLERLRLHPAEEAEIRLEVIGLSLRHGLVTPYTAFVAVDAHSGDGRDDHDPRRVEVPLPMPHGLDVEGAEADRLDEPSSPMAPPPSLRASRMAPPGMDAMLSDSMVTRPSPAPIPMGIAGAPKRAGLFERARSMVASAFGGEGDDDGAEAAAPPTGGGARPIVQGAPPPQITAEAYSADVLRWAKGKAGGELDLVFLVDETGSMGSYIAEVQRNILQIITAIQGSPLCRSLRVGLVSYRDHPPQDSSFVTRVQALTTDANAVKTAVLRMHASGGGDGPEAVTDGLYDLLKLDWRPRAQRTVVWIGDAPPHGVEPSGDGFPQGCPCGRNWYAQAESAREMGIVVHAVACMPALSHYQGAEQVYRTVARIARGLYVPLAQAQLLVPLITGVAESELDKQRIEEMVAEAIAAHEEELRALDADGQRRRLTELMQAQKASTRALTLDEKDVAGTLALRFRPVDERDVEESLEKLRRTNRTSI